MPVEIGNQFAPVEGYLGKEDKDMVKSMEEQRKDDALNPGNFRMTFGGTSGDATHQPTDRKQHRKHDLMQLTFPKARQQVPNYDDGTKEIVQEFLLRAANKLMENGKAIVVLLNNSTFNGAQLMLKAAENAGKTLLGQSCTMDIKPDPNTINPTQNQNQASQANERYDRDPKFWPTNDDKIYWMHMKTDGKESVRISKEVVFTITYMRDHPSTATQTKI